MGKIKIMRVILNNTRKGNVYRETNSLLDARMILNAYRDSLNLLSSEMDLGFGDVYIKGKLVYQISYNGKVSMAKDELQEIVKEKIEKIKEDKNGN